MNPAADTTKLQETKIRSNRAQQQEQENTTPGASQSASMDRLPFESFVWGAGIECSFLPHLNVDQFQWTQHDRFWREDLKRFKNEAGLSHLRYAFPWHVLEAEPGRF